MPHMPYGLQDLYVDLRTGDFAITPDNIDAAAANTVRINLAIIEYSGTGAALVLWTQVTIP